MAYKYNPKKVILILNKLRITGFAKGSFITAKPDEEAAKKSTGNDGKATVTLNPNEGASIEFTLQQASPINDLLSAMIPSAKNNSLITGDVLLEDLNGTTVCHGDVAWLKGWPEVGFGDDAGERKYVIDVEEMDWLVGGNIL